MIQIPAGILQEACDDQHNDQTDRKRCNDGYTLQVCHGTVGEGQGDRTQDQHDGPEHFYISVRIFIAGQLLVSISRSNQGDGVEAGRIECDHGCNEEHDDDRSQTKSLDNGKARVLQITARIVNGHDIESSVHLKSEAVVSEDDEA